MQEIQHDPHHVYIRTFATLVHIRTLGFWKPANHVPNGIHGLAIQDNSILVRFPFRRWRTGCNPKILFQTSSVWANCKTVNTELKQKCDWENFSVCFLDQITFTKCKYCPTSMDEIRFFFWLSIWKWALSSSCFKLCTPLMCRRHTVINKLWNIWKAYWQWGVYGFLGWLYFTT